MTKSIPCIHGISNLLINPKEIDVKDRERREAVADAAHNARIWIGPGIRAIGTLLTNAAESTVGYSSEDLSAIGYMLEGLADLNDELTVIRDYALKGGWQ